MELPYEVLEQIMLRTTAPIVIRCSLVCLEWNRSLQADEKMWKHFTTKFSTIEYYKPASQTWREACVDVERAAFNLAHGRARIYCCASVSSILAPSRRSEKYSLLPSFFVPPGQSELIINWLITTGHMFRSFSKAGLSSVHKNTTATELITGDQAQLFSVGDYYVLTPFYTFDFYTYAPLWSTLRFAKKSEAAPEILKGLADFPFFPTIEDTDPDDPEEYTRNLLATYHRDVTASPHDHHTLHVPEEECDALFNLDPSFNTVAICHPVNTGTIQWHLFDLSSPEPTKPIASPKTEHHAIADSLRNKLIRLAGEYLILNHNSSVWRIHALTTEKLDLTAAVMEKPVEHQHFYCTSTEVGVQTQTETFVINIKTAALALYEVWQAQVHKARFAFSADWFIRWIMESPVISIFSRVPASVGKASQRLVPVANLSPGFNPGTESLRFPMSVQFLSPSQFAILDPATAIILDVSGNEENRRTFPVFVFNKGEWKSETATRQTLDEKAAALLSKPFGSLQRHFITSSQPNTRVVVIAHTTFALDGTTGTTERSVVFNARFTPSQQLWRVSSDNVGEFIDQKDRPSEFFCVAHLEEFIASSGLWTVPEANPLTLQTITPITTRFKKLPEPFDTFSWGTPE